MVLRLIVLALAGLLLVACGGAPVADTAHGGSHGDSDGVSPPVSGAPEATVTAVDLDFEPATLELTAGKPTNITIVNKGEALHDFTLEEAGGLHVNVPAGNEVTTAVTVKEAGSYRAICTVPGHEDAGMVVDVEVTD